MKAESLSGLVPKAPAPRQVYRLRGAVGLGVTAVQGDVTVKRKVALVLSSGFLFHVAGLGACIEQARQVLLPPEATPGTCFELSIDDQLIEIPCSIFD